MGFLSPWFFAGLAALALPLWLHLLRQFKRTPQPFSSIMFFERRVQSSTRHRRLRYLALLAARLALLALLALAFANPFVNRRAAVLKRKSLSVIAIDRSFSMRYGNRMQQAKTLAHLSIAALPAGSRAEVVAVDSHVEPQTALETDKSMLNAAVDGISAGDDASSYGEFSRTLRVTEQTSGMHIDAHFFTDAQQSSMPAAFADLQVGPDTTLNVQSVGHGGSPNWAVVSVNAPPHVYDPAQTRVSATIAGWNTRPAQRKVSLVLDGKTVATKEVSIPDCGSTSVEFTSLDIPYGVHRAEVRIEPHDDLPQDDSFGFSMERSDPRRVLFLYARGRVNQAFYYKAALESSNTSGLIVEARPIEGALQEDLSRYVFVVLNDPGAVDGALDSHICGYISKGGAAFIAAGAETTRSGIIPMAHNEVAATDRAVQGAG
ncbi:MAG: VWA domain-containing protein, partial [Acidobacteriaceae bacterium]|nr:VWA domain-containing protein [Acidobacteriaceae bacterium]